MNNFSKNPFVIFSSLTEDTGHLMLDDIFWFDNLINKFPNTRIFTSKTSANNLLRKYPTLNNNIYSFKDFPFLKKISYRLFIIARLIFSEKIKNSNIIFQAFDEIGILIYFIRICKRNNKFYVIPTNNISPERLIKSRWLLQWMLRKIIVNSDRIFYHTDFECELIKSYISISPYVLKKCYKLKYHLIGEGKKEVVNENLFSDFVISYFGPTMISKPISDFCDLMKADNFANGKFQFRIVNVSSEVKEVITSIFGEKNKIDFINEYFVHEEYIKLIQASKYVFLPHNHLYEGKLSGILSDCISNGIPVISNKIEPLLEFFKNYGEMGFIFDFSSSTDWCSRFLENCNDEKYIYFKTSMLKCKNDHSHDKIINEFIYSIE